MKKSRRVKYRWAALAAILLLLAAGAAALLRLGEKEELPGASEILSDYMSLIEAKDYEGMYRLIDVSASGNISEEAFVTRNRNIYEGIELSALSIDVTDETEADSVTYQSTFDTVAGTVSFSNTARFTKGDEGYRLIWEDGLIFPGLRSSDKVRVSVTAADRGSIVDRKGDGRADGRFLCRTGSHEAG